MTFQKFIDKLSDRKLRVTKVNLQDDYHKVTIKTRDKREINFEGTDLEQLYINIIESTKPL